MIRAITILTAILACALPTHAQFWDDLCLEPVSNDTAQVGNLAVKVDAMAFFRDNEYDSHVTKGYTLPGVWLRPALTLDPIKDIHLELGMYAIFYDGANKYPSYAFHDIATWKGSQYQKGIHCLPWFRFQAHVRNLTLVLGDIYGKQNHGFIEPMYNPEQNLSVDPEMGFQLKLNRKHVDFDGWIDWQSFIYELDSHQEAFTVGATTNLHWDSKRHSRVTWEIPIQMVLQHRGGEQDTTTLGVQTVANASVGARFRYRPRRPVLTAFTAEANLLTSLQMSGSLWPFDNGFAAHAAVGLTLWNQLDLTAGYFDAPKQYANLYGSPFFGTISTKFDGKTFDHMRTAYVRAGYTYKFSEDYRLGAEVMALSSNAPNESAFVCSFGVYIRISPSFIIHRFRK